MVEEDILKYLEGTLSDADHTAFEQQLSQDEDLAKAVASYREMKSFAKSKVTETKALLAAESVYKKHKQALRQDAQRTLTISEPVKKNKSMIKYLIPISIAAAVLLGIFVTQNLTTSESSLYSNYFDPDDIGLVSRSERDQSLLEAAERQFNQGDYASAQGSLAKLIEQYPNQEIYKLYHSISQLANGETGQARKTLELLSTNESYRNESLYYLGLSYVGEKNKEQAIKYLSQINDQYPKYTMVQELISQLK